MTYDVNANLRIRVKARDGRAAEDLVLHLLENHLSDMLDCPAVIQTGIPLTPTNPHAEPVAREKENNNA